MKKKSYKHAKRNLLIRIREMDFRQVFNFNYIFKHWRVVDLKGNQAPSEAQLVIQPVVLVVDQLLDS